VLEGEGLPGLAPGPHLLATAVAREAILDRLMAAVRPAACDQDRNDGLARAVAQRLSFDYEQFASMRMLTLLAPHEVIQLAADGVDFQLHTHRHRSPDDAALLTREIRENRERVERMTGRPATHFCWPSGVYWRTQLATLAAESVVTATTCEPGFARADSEPLLLPRFVDTSFVSDNAFASWLEGTAALGARRP
jgi:peptidoglycan/xylan/chitin deacetylase (PgdA/CDA1 family)